ncbi:MAG: hypothetical protein JXR95_07330 [Deltaproteobacteria bacterium]|nr:hypothetical protein [Deltaproteobacteria bacterium]
MHRFFIKLRVCFIGLMLITSFSGVVIARSPSRRSCPELMSKAILNKIKSDFPAYKLKTRGQCTYFSGDAQVPLKPIQILTPSGIKFHIPYPMAIKKEVYSSDFGSRKKNSYIYTTAPIPSVQVAKKAGLIIRKNSLFIKTFGRKNIVCTASSDAPGGCAYILCAETSRRSADIKGSGSELKFRMLLGKSRGKKPEYTPELTGFSLPLQLARHSNVWKRIKSYSEIKTFIKNNSSITVEKNNWHKDYLILKSKSSSIVAVLLDSGIHICKDTKPFMCISKIKR